MNILTICDNNDTKRGEYFSTSEQNLIDKLQPNISSHQSLKTKDCQKSLDNYTPNFNGKPFLCVAYAHGNESSIAVDNENYIHFENSYLFNQSFFYACCCLSAKQLGQQMMDNGCKVFLGFDEVISSCTPEAEGIYQECENAFLSFFVNDGLTIEACQSKLYDLFINRVIHLSLEYGINEASIFEANFNAFKVLCNDTSITKNEFM